MAPARLSAAILAIEGTNCDAELRTALTEVGTAAEVVHLNQLTGRSVEPSERRRLLDYDLALIPGGFSAGDYVRAGAIFAARLATSLRDDLESFVRSGRLLGGICNGFQVLVELGLLPGRPDGRIGSPEAVLLPNDSGRFECRPTFVAWTGGRFGPLKEWPAGARFLFPSAHAEGKLVFAEPAEERRRDVEAAGQVLFRWVAPDGSPAAYPWNPNGSAGDIAGLVSPAGNVFGLMPHPERAFFARQMPEPTRPRPAGRYGDGYGFFRSLVDYARGEMRATDASASSVGEPSTARQRAARPRAIASPPR